MVAILSVAILSVAILRGAKLGMSFGGPLESPKVLAIFATDPFVASG
ncbi:hypothetical protein RSSM_01280 [Rhodopirellula sallentina SM41]|uniref:Uncharacterized protein n=1 Tax=Rhodopirellula sallentina SM41 TaxID=1263870 RepID=M5UMR4_9BACT|nr:hypothetical protein RSSM_01280 [Rhodopirellula sallentina SM41]